MLHMILSSLHAERSGCEQTQSTINMNSQGSNGDARRRKHEAGAGGSHRLCLFDIRIVGISERSRR